ncbi:hypothetical protein SAMN05444369_101315 [Capnocytophaga haemolytica]|uniref:Phage protein n=1 Tax=Capnocytophaga haemolytica TaxID=45243 RepID=A0AAX2GYC1_9FLAO|nr:hypothetical protein [Capnocytophaga haemolytica]AMD85097.1 hypothetical protein AXF12_05925 [Capnocytophaga haemolytica]SFN68367.1 hypothetical protein SAMN05444369_101315 [Capnocytophaga haemolytica]SNV05060.1 Uncharacterised protein [Capnocytophaga haemolytica]
MKETKNAKAIEELYNVLKRHSKQLQMMYDELQEAYKKAGNDDFSKDSVLIIRYKLELSEENAYAGIDVLRMKQNLNNNNIKNK